MVRRTGRLVVEGVALAGLVVAWWWVRFDPGQPREALDTVLYFLPSYAAIADRFRDGVVPLWNPWNLCGLPWIGTLQGGVFYPGHVLYLVLPLHRALAASGALHLVVTALATAAFVRRLGLGGAAAFLAAVAFTVRGTVATSVPSPNLLEAAAWLPVGALALVDLVRAPGGGPIALLAAATGLSFLAGYPQPTVYAIYAWGTLFVALLIHERPSGTGVAIRVAAFAAGLAAGGLVAAVQMVPALELMRSGTRASDGLTDLTMFPFSPWMTPATSVLWRESIEGTPYAMGVIALALVPVAVLAPARRVLGVWALALAALSATFALGRLTPLFDLYLALPALRLFRNPGRLLVVTDFALAIAAGLGLSALSARREPDGAPARAWRLAVPVVGMALGLAGVLELVRRGWAPHGAALIPTFTAVSVVAIGALLGLRASWRPAIGAALALAATVEIASNPGSEFRMPYAAEDVARYDTLSRELRDVAQMAGHERVWRVLPGLQIPHALRLAGWHRLRTLNDYEPVNLQRQSDFFLYLRDGSATAKQRPWLFTGDVDRLEAPPGGTAVGTRRRLLDVAAVRLVLLGRNALLAPPIRTLVEQAGWVRRRVTTSFLIYENPQAVPRAFVTYRVRSAPADADTLLGAMSSPAFDPLAESFVEGPPPFATTDDAPRGHPAVFVRDDETDVELASTLARSGLVVLADSFYPGWHATVDGVAAPIVATNHLFRGVPVPAGTHRVRFVYAPASVRIGGLLSVLGACLVVALWLWPRHLPAG